MSSTNNQHQAGQGSLSGQASLSTAIRAAIAGLLLTIAKTMLLGTSHVADRVRDAIVGIVAAAAEEDARDPRPAGHGRPVVAARLARATLDSLASLFELRGKNEQAEAIRVAIRDVIDPMIDELISASQRGGDCNV